MVLKLNFTEYFDWFVRGLHCGGAKEEENSLLCLFGHLLWRCLASIYFNGFYGYGIWDQDEGEQGR